MLVLLLMASLGLAATTVWALDPGQPPGGNFDLTHWKLQLPTDGGALTCTNLGVDEVTPAQLEAGFTNAYFYTGSGGEMVFWCPVNGATTSGTSNPRSELRELINPSTSAANWFAWGTHILDGQCKVLQVSTAPGSAKKVIIGQIHGYSGAALPTVKLQYNNGTLEGFIKRDATNTANETKFTFVKNVGLNSNITYQIKVVNGLITITMNGVTNSQNIFVTDPQWQNENMYFKAGDYNQDENCSNPSTNYGARVSFSAVTLFHAPSITNQPASQVVTVGSNVTFTVGAAGNPPLRYFWKFNGASVGGNSATLSVPNVQLTNAGSYSVIITDSVGTVNSVVTSSVATLTVLPPPPTASFNASPTNGLTPLSVTFTNTSTGSFTNSFWSFGDGSTFNAVAATNVVHSYGTGTWLAKLIVTGAGGVSTSAAVTITVVSAPPTANFAASPTNGVEPLSVTFTNTSTGPFTSSSWSFGDGGTLNTGAATNVVHSYAAGTYDVTLVVTGPGGVSTNIKPNYILVMPAFQGWQIQYFGDTNNPAAASGADPDGDGQNNQMEFLAGMDPTNNVSQWRIQASPTNGFASLVVDFTDNSTGASITNRLWDFGDGNTGTGTNPSHTYTNAGTFSVSLTIFNLYGTTTLIASNLIDVLPTPTIVGMTAANLQDASGNLAPSNSVAVLVVDTGNNGFSDAQVGFALGAGATWGTDDKVVAVWDLRDSLGCSGNSGGGLCAEAVVSHTNGIAYGQQLQLYWFPSLTLASNVLGNTQYGKYSDLVGLDGSDVWTMPTEGNYLGLWFITAALGGSNPDLAGQASLFTVEPLTADFTAIPTSGVAPLNVAFTDTSTGSPASWVWDFGDAGTSTLQNPSHNYTTGGVYTVQLIASNTGGSSTNTKTAYINVYIDTLQSWSTYYGVPADAADADGDGMSNTNEFLAGTDPTSNAAYLHVISIVKAANDINVTYLGANGDTNYTGGPVTHTNVLEFTPGTANGSYSNNFVSAGQTNILSGGNGAGAVTNMVDTGGATNVPSRYYRVRVLVP